MRIDGRVVRPALLRDPPTLRRPPCRLRLSTDDQPARAGARRTVICAPEHHERADVHDITTLCALIAGDPHCEGGGKDAADRVVDDSEEEAARCRRVCGPCGPEART